MTDTKAIRRYKLVTHDVHASAFPDQDGNWVRHADHLSALDYWKAYAEECRETATEMIQAKAAAEAALTAERKRWREEIGKLADEVRKFGDETPHTHADATYKGGCMPAYKVEEFRAWIEAELRKLIEVKG